MSGNVVLCAMTLVVCEVVDGSAFLVVGMSTVQCSVHIK